MYCRVLNLMSTDVSEVCAASIIRAMMEAARTSGTSVDVQLRTRQYIPEESELHTRRRENLKSYIKVS
jgi:predicted RNA methylase